ARFAHEPEPLAAGDRQAHTLDGVELAAAGQLEPHVEVLDGEERAHSDSALRPTSGRSRKVRAPRCATRRRGLSASSSACPTRLQPRMTSATSAPGGTIAHHAPEEIAARWKAFSITFPSEIRLGSPRPRNESAVSSKTATATVRTVFAIRSGATCGSTCRRT